MVASRTADGRDNMDIKSGSVQTNNDTNVKSHTEDVDILSQNKNLNRPSIEAQKSHQDQALLDKVRNRATMYHREMTETQMRDSSEVADKANANFISNQIRSGKSSPVKSMAP